MEYPWQKPGELTFQENKWIMVHKEFKTMKVIYNDQEVREYDVFGLDKIDLQNLVDCFRGWVQKVQLLSMDTSKMEQTKKIAKLTANVMR